MPIRCQFRSFALTIALLSFVWFGVALSILFGSFHVLVCRKEPDGAWRVAMEHIG